MKFNILGVFDQGFAGYLFELSILVFFLIVVIEAAVMLIMKYHPFKKAFTQSLITNLIAVGLALILTRFFPERFSSYGFQGQIPMIIITFLGELATLYFLNSSKPFIKTIATCTVMNLVSYLLIFILKIGE